MDKTQMFFLFIKILCAKLAGAGESRTDFVSTVKAALDQFVEEVPVYAKKQ